MPNRRCAAAASGRRRAPLRLSKRDWIGVNVDPRVYSLELPDERTRWMLELHTSLDRIFDAGRGREARRRARATSRRRRSLDDQRLVLRQPLLTAHARLRTARRSWMEADCCDCIEMAHIIRVDAAAGRFDWDEFLAMAVARTGAARFTYPALSLVEYLAPGTDRSAGARAGPSELDVGCASHRCAVSFPRVALSMIAAYCDS